MFKKYTVLLIGISLSHISFAMNGAAEQVALQEHKKCLVMMPDEATLRSMFDEFGLQYFVEKTEIISYWQGEKTVSGIELAKQLMLADFAKYLGAPHGRMAAAQAELSLNAIIDEILQNNPTAQKEMQIFRESIKKEVAASPADKLPQSMTQELIVQDIEVLRPYYQAIKHIRNTLDAAAAKYECESGFVGWPTPNPFYCRTPKYLFLETSSYSRDRGEKLCVLYSPFGQVKLLGSGFLDNLLNISAEFLTKMNWQLEDVTQGVHVYNYNHSKNVKYGPYPFKKEEYKGSGTKSKLYLVKSVHDTDFRQKNDELMVLDGFILADGQYEKDKQQFEQLSGGTNQF